MEPQELTSPADINRRTESWFHLPAEEDRSQFLGLEFQDSRLSPALALLPEYDFSGYSLFQQTTDLEFAPLRGSPYVSVASERFLTPRAKKGSNGVVQPSDPHRASLSQHPLAYTSTLSEHPLGHTSTLSQSEEMASSCCSLSEHSMSPGDGLGQPEEDRYPVTVRDNEGQKTHRSGTRTSLLDPDRPLAVLPDDSASFLSGDIPARKLLELLQKDVGMPSGSSSAVSSVSEISLNRINFFGGESRSDSCVSKPDCLREERNVSQRVQPNVSPELQPDVSPELQPDVSPELQPDVSPELQPDISPPVTGRREGPQGGASVSPENTEKLKSKQSSRMSEISNITIRSLSSQPDESSNALRRQLCSELEKSLDSEPGAESQGGASRGPITSLHSEVNTPDIVTNRPNVSTTGSTKGRLSVTRGLLASVLGQGAGVGAQFSAGFSVERGHRERDLWSSGNQTGIEPDVSFLSLLPQPVSQSTPGVFLHAPVRSSTKMSALTFNMEVSQRSSDSRVSPQPAVVTLPDRHIPVQDPLLPARETVQEPSGRSHHSLPSLNYLQKVDAWKTNQSSNKMSFYDNLSLQGFSGVFPKQKAYDAVSDSLTRMLTLPQLGNQTLSRCESGPSSPTRGEAAGSGLPEREDTVRPVGGPSPLCRSQSHSSLNTVVTSIQRAHRAQTHTDQDSSQTQTEEESAPGQPREFEKNQGVSDRVQSGGGPKQPSHFISLGRFSNVSSNRDVLSSSQDSGHSGQNFEVSVRAASSSVVSLGVDNYAPYWSSKPSSPHKERELNIEERIPMYLHNLGIDQSPSTILNPFGPRGPIREPEFSPTDLCTIKGSTATGTPTKSTQPSEGDSPHKGEFSRSSLLSVASSMSLPLSVDSLHLYPIRSQAENTRGCMSSSPGPDRDRSPSQGSLRMALCPLDISVENTELQDSQQDSHCLQPSSPAPQSTQPLDLHIYQLPAPQSNHQKYPGLLPDLQSSEQHQRDRRVNVSTQAAIEMAGRLESSADSLSQYRDRVKNSLSQYKDGDRDSLYSDRDMDEDILSQYRDMDRDVLSQYRDGAVASCPQVNTTMDRSNPDDSFVGSQTLQDIRLLLGRAENIVSGGSTSSGASSHLLHSNDDILLLSLRRKMEGFQDSSFTSSSGGAGVGDPRSHSSLLWARSSSDSMLPADRKRDEERESSAYSGEGHVRLTREAEQLSTPAREESGRLLRDSEHYGRPQDSSENREHYGRPPQDSSEDREHYGRPPQDSSEDREHYGRPPQDISGSSSTFLLTESVRRAEPEGCSAGLSDTRIGPVLLSVMPVSQPGPSLGDAGGGKLQQAPTTTMGGGNTVQVAPAEGNSSSSSFSCPVGSEQGFGGLSEPARGGDQGGDALSDGGGSSSSGGSSLAARVARLLQSESPATVVSLSSRASTATSDLEESRAREWLRLKVSGQQCETLELNTVDRQRIEEIKREILFNHPLKSQRSMDTDSSSASSLVGPGGQPPSLPQPEEQLDGEQQQFRALRAAEDCLSHQLQQLSGNPFDDSVELRTPLRQDLEARVRQIALREGIYVLPRTHLPPLTSITIATSRRSPLPEPLQVSQFTLDGVSQPTVQGWLPQTQQQERESNATSTPCSVSRDSTTTTGSQANSSSLYPRDRKTRLGQERGQERGQEPGQVESQLPGRDQENHFTGPPHSAAPLPLTPGMYGQMSCSHPDVGRPGSIMGSGEDWVSGAWTTRTGYVSHLHLTLSPGPKGAEERSRRLLSFAPVRHSSAVSSSIDVDKSPSYAPEPSPANQTGSQENRDPICRQGQETADASAQITTGTSTATSTFPQCFTPPQRLTGTGPSRQAALSVLLPYKPHGSEMFYVSQTHPDPQLSPVRSDSIGESTHPGSDDAVPPRFNIEILGSREQQVDKVVDRGVNIKHTEGIYSKRLRLGENYSMERTGGLTRGPAVPSTTTRGPAIPSTTTRGPAIPSTTTRGPAIPTTTTRGPAVPTTTTRGPAVPTTTTRGPAVPTTTTRGPAVPSTTTRGPAVPSTTTRGPAVPSTTTRGPAVPSTTTRGPAIPTTTTRGPAVPSTTTRGPAVPSTTTRGPAVPTTTTRGPAIPTTTTRGPSGATRDHGTSITTSTHTQGVPDTDRPVQPSLRCSLEVGEEELEVFQPLHVEMDYSSLDLHHHFPKTHPTHHLHMDHQISNIHLVRTSAPDPGMEREPGRQDHSLARRCGSTLDQLWRRFSERWSLEEARPTNEREASLLERLERLSRLIHSTGNSAPPEPEPRQQTDTTEQDGGGRRRERKSGRKEEERRREGVEEGRRREGVEEGRRRREKSNSGRSDPDAKANQAKASVPRQAWELQDEEPQPAEGEDCSASYSSSPSHRPARSQYLCPAERESSGSISGETSSSMSTIDTARLVRAFGAHRVRGLNTGGTSSSHRTSHSLSKLYSTILQQRQSKEQRRGRSRETPHVPSESTGTDDSVIPADSASSTSTYTLPSHRGPSHSKKAVKHVSKGVQAGDLEIVSNGTRRHTRDVGTTFPSPGSARGARVLPSSHSGSKRVRAGDRSPQKTKRKMSQPFAKPYYPQGVSWYIPAENLRAEGRKENKPEQQPPRGPAWFEPYSRTTRPWREPLRQRQIQDRERLTDRLQTNQLEADRDRPNERQHIKHSVITPPGPEPTGNAPAALVRISLQEALELRRPEFVSRSRERVKRLVLQVEERKLQVVFSRERNDLFNQPRRPGRLSQPAGTAVFQRAVPKKELVQRSKQMYEQLPEVQRRREEEKRREEYRSYRLNAQLYNKRITNRVLGRQTPWQ
ncbi:uncharacterized protein alms1 isoform X2 [Salmo salar]|uniref:Uncharacterized protein alms1 isoform X2 n=1 Tax=Salmo salar TaxID=8030 RepID=A0A1S3SS46_SALSA|nr:uncharacterized protein alms1 isoform X2 [Salmo salar]